MLIKSIENPGCMLTFSVIPILVCSLQKIKACSGWGIVGGLGRGLAKDP